MKEKLELFAFKILILISTIIINGILFAYLWTWFIAEPFHIQPLSIANAIGIFFMLRLAAYAPPKSDNEEEKTINTVYKEFKSTLFKTLILMLIGYFIHLFI